jgi:hypothetical protein
MAALAAFVSNLPIILYLGPVGACIIITQWPVFMSVGFELDSSKLFQARRVFD